MSWNILNKKKIGEFEKINKVTFYLITLLILGNTINRQSQNIETIATGLNNANGFAVYNSELYFT